jgi:hypothetical protein
MQVKDVLISATRAEFEYFVRFELGSSNVEKQKVFAKIMKFTRIRLGEELSTLISRNFCSSITDFRPETIVPNFLRPVQDLVPWYTRCIIPNFLRQVHDPVHSVQWCRFWITELSELSSQKFDGYPMLVSGNYFCMTEFRVFIADNSIGVNDSE